jgi:predicted aspartyl protease
LKNNNLINLKMLTELIFENAYNQVMETNKKYELIEENYKLAYQNIPQSLFGAKSPYIRIKIGNNYYKTLIDTGAEMSVIPEIIVKNENLEYLIDDRYKSRMYGVGNSISLGKIHYLEITFSKKKVNDSEYDNYEIPNSFTVLPDSNGMDNIILGMDFINNYSININFKKYQLEFENFNIPFNFEEGFCKK